MTKILLVEDDKSLREIYGVRLLAEGYDIVSAGDGEEALAMAIKEKPTLIISDVMMPKISGFDMLDILRSTTETRDIKVIMMTALSSDDQRSRGEQLGADRYLVKSQVGIEDVVRTVHEVLSDSTAASATAASVTAPEQTVAPTPAADNSVVPAAADPVTTPAADIPAPTAPVVDTPVDSVSSNAASAPGNDTAGPLPPQPTETESTLPEPTAPFTSPRPTNLGERVIQPINNDLDTPEGEGNVSEQIEQELQASAEPVTSTQVDEAITDTEVTPVATGESGVTAASPAVEPTPETAPSIAESTPEPAPAPESTPAEPLVETTPEQQSQSTPSSEEKPTITGVSGSVS